MGPSGHPSPGTGVGHECSARGLLRRPPALPVCPHPTSCRSCLGSLARGCVGLPSPVGFGRAPCNAAFFPRAFRRQTCSFFPSFVWCFGLAGDGWVAVGAGHCACLQRRRWQDRGAGSSEPLRLGHPDRTRAGPRTAHCSVQPRWEGPGGTSEPRVPVLLRQPRASGSMGLGAVGSIVPTTAPPGTVRASQHGRCI